MKQSTIKDVRTTLIVLLVSILSSASAIYILPTVIAPVHAGFSNPSWTTNPTPVPVGTPFSVQVNVPAGQSVTYITVLFSSLHALARLVLLPSVQRLPPVQRVQELAGLQAPPPAGALGSRPALQTPAQSERQPVARHRAVWVPPQQ